MEELTVGATVRGVVPDALVSVVGAKWFGQDALDLTYKLADGSVATRLVYRDDEPSLEIAEAGRPWSFDGDGAMFRLVSEAKRIDLAYLFDPYLAVSTSLIDPLPHQITAVYGEMLPRQPLRFLLADDPGAGKTIMTGLLIRELLVRGDLRRCLIVSPGSLVEQWQQELSEKFQLTFDILSRDQIENTRSGNPFNDADLLIARLDKLSRDEDLLLKLEQSEDWDLIVFDEAHKLSATLTGDEVKKTKRRLLGDRTRDLTRHFLLLTATPHNGKEDDFQLFLSLLDADRFEGHRRTPGQQAAKTDANDIMRRLLKEDLVKFDGKPLFPPRFAYVVPYKLSEPEAALYEQVTTYVRDEMNRAERLKAEGEKKRGLIVGFALTVLQRRLASSPEAIYQSLRRRRERLERKLAETELLREGAQARLDNPELDAIGMADVEDLEEADDDEVPADETEELEEQVLDAATAARTVAELRAEIQSLTGLESLAQDVRRRGTDTKWVELSGLLQEHPEMRDAGGGYRKLVIFTEHRDTLNYLLERLRTLTGRPESVVEIHGGMHREARRTAEASFKNDPDVHILVATDAAGEGINLQRAHLMVNYDLPWNPNRLEQRFGRIHRIGQQEVCHLWNLVAEETREGDVYRRLLEKLQVESEALGGRVFDVLGRLTFGDKSLRNLLIEAIRANDSPEIREHFDKVIESALDREALQLLLSQRAIGVGTLSAAAVQEIRLEMERAEARRLQPHFIRSFFLTAFRELGGKITEREPDRYEVSWVPAVVRQRARDAGRRPPLVNKYERVVFDKNLISVPDRPLAEFVCPGHALLDSTIDVLLEQHRDLLRRGSVLVDRLDPSTEPRVLVYLEHSIVDQRTTSDGRPRLVSRRLDFVELRPDGTVEGGGPAPYQDYDPPTAEEATVAAGLLDGDWLGEGVEDRSLEWAVANISREHFDSVRQRTHDRVDRTLAAVHERLTHEISYWDRRAEEIALKEQSGRTPKLNSARARARAAELAERLKHRRDELARERDVRALAPVVVGGAVIVPQGLLDQAMHRTPTPPLDTRKSEALAMAAVMAVERANGYAVTDVSKANCGYDVEAIHPQTGDIRFIEVKGRAPGAKEVTVTRNEILTCLNKPGAYWLAIVAVDGDLAGEPWYLLAPFDERPDFAATSVNFAMAKLRSREPIRAEAI